MRNILVIGLLLLGWSCSQQNGYKIEVAIDGANSLVLLEQREGGQFIVKDSARVENGKAVLEGTVEFPEVYYLNVDNQNQRGFLFVENARMKVTGHIDSLRNLKVTGSPVNDEYQAIKAVLDADSEKGMAKYQEYQMAVQQGDTNAAAIMAEVQAIFTEQENKMIDFIKNNPASYVVPMMLQQVQQSREPEELEGLISSLDPKVAATPAVTAISERLVKLRQVAVGMTAPDFVANDPDGNPIKLSEVYAQNEYTLIDFWAAWCGPCRMENPNVVAVFNDYKDKGFGVFGVSLDRTKEEWLKAIEDDKLTWPHVSDLKFWQSEPAALYSVNAIPANFLVDKQGKIVAKNLREQALRDKIAELLP
jgi:peroxiredoxin